MAYKMLGGPQDWDERKSEEKTALFWRKCENSYFVILLMYISLLIYRIIRVFPIMQYLMCPLDIEILCILQMALQPGVGLGLLYNMPPGLSIPCSVSLFVYTHLSQVHGHVIQPSHFWSSSSSCCIQLSAQHLFWDCGV